MKNKNTITLNGKPSTEITGLLIQEFAPISKPLIRSEIEEIDGRNGDVVTTLGYSAYDKEVTIGLYGAFDIDEVIAYFDSEGTVTFSNEPDKYYNYQILEQIDFERLVRYRTATVTFHIQPFKYSTQEGNLILDPPATNLLSFSDYTSTSNGVTLTATDGIVTISGTPTAATEFYLPINSLAVNAGSYTLSATASGTNPNYCSIRLIGSAPSDADSFGNKYITLAQGTVTLQDTLAESETYGYLWFYMNAGQTFDFDVTFAFENDAEKSTSAEGTELALLGTAEAPFKQLTIKGNTAQAASPTPTEPVEVQVVKNQEMIRLTGKNLASADELSLLPTVERISGGLRATITDSTLVTFYAPFRTLPAGTFTISFDARSANADATVLTLASTAAIWGQSGLVLKDENGDAADAGYRKLTKDWKRFSFTVTLNTSYPWIGDLAMILFFSAYTNSPIFELQNFQIEFGTVATAFDGSEPQTIPLDLRTGKNLLSTEFFSMGALVSGIPVSSVLYRINNALAPIRVKPNTTYTLSADLLSPVMGLMVDVQQCAANFQYTASSGWQQLADGDYTFTTDAGIYYVMLCFGISTTSATVTEGSTEDTTEYSSPKEWLRGTTLQLEESDSATTYEEYESMELCSIAGHQDYIMKSGDNWYFHKETGKLTLNGTEDWTYESARSAFFLAVDDAINSETRGIYALSNRFLGVLSTTQAAQWADYDDNTIGIRYQTPPLAPKLGIKTTLANTVASWQNWLAANNTEVHYVLNEPVDVQITNEFTLEQLNSLKNTAHAYNGVTFVSLLPGGSTVLPPTIAVEVVKQSDGEVTNSGNTTAKPKLTIYGEGDIEVILNGYQIFQIALGENDHITIDTAAMEAYQDTTETLMNRLVIGDYNNFALNPGTNEITFSGTVTQCIVENYSRWI